MPLSTGRRQLHPTRSFGPDESIMSGYQMFTAATTANLPAQPTPTTLLAAPWAKHDWTINSGTLHDHNNARLKPTANPDVR